MKQTMKVARLHAQGKSMSIEELPISHPNDTEVLVEVNSVHVAPSIKALLSPGGPFIIPKLPAIFGIDTTGTISDAGKHVVGLNKGDRVYINPLISCKTCEFCISGREEICNSMAFMGLFTFSQSGLTLLEKYSGGFAQYMKVPSQNIISIPDNISFEHAARFGYLGTAYNALKKANVHYGSSVLINGSTGVMGVGAVMLSIAMGAKKIIAVARNEMRLKKVKQIAPSIIDTVIFKDSNISKNVMDITNNMGTDAYVDCLTYADISSSQQSLSGLKKGGTAVFIGGAQGNISIPYGMFVGTEIQLTGSLWFHNHDITEISRMAVSGNLNLNILETKSFKLEQVNEAIDFADSRPGGFNNIVVQP